MGSTTATKKLAALNLYSPVGQSHGYKLSFTCWAVEVIQTCFHLLGSTTDMQSHRKIALMRVKDLSVSEEK